MGHPIKLLVIKSTMYTPPFRRLDLFIELFGYKKGLYRHKQPYNTWAYYNK
jgi:hypothetical protein